MQIYTDVIRTIFRRLTNTLTKFIFRIFMLLFSSIIFIKGSVFLGADSVSISIEVKFQYINGHHFEFFIEDDHLRLCAKVIDVQWASCYTIGLLSKIEFSQPRRYIILFNVLIEFSQTYSIAIV